MVFVLDQSGEKLLLMLTEKDLQLIRQGRTLFVDQRQLQGGRFESVVVGYAKTDTDAIDMIKTGQRIHEAKTAPIPDPTEAEGRCDGCDGCVAKELLYEGRCNVCWATEAKAARSRSN